MRKLSLSSYGISGIKSVSSPSTSHFLFIQAETIAQIIGLSHSISVTVQFPVSVMLSGWSSQVAGKLIKVLLQMRIPGNVLSIQCNDSKAKFNLNNAVYEVASGSETSPCIKIHKPLVQILISSPPAPPLPASFSCPSPPAPIEIWL